MGTAKKTVTESKITTSSTMEIEGGGGAINERINRT